MTIGANRLHVFSRPNFGADLSQPNIRKLLVPVNNTETALKRLGKRGTEQLFSTIYRLPNDVLSYHSVKPLYAVPCCMQINFEH